MDDTPMFPLGTVLVPGMPLSLHVFEPRYRALTERCLATNESFGVALIERGWEVGGGDQRFPTACLASIFDAERFDDGRYAVVAAGTDRVRVTQWLVDDPYPRAIVEPWPDVAEVSAAADDVRALRVAVRRMFALASEAGIDTPPATVELAEDAETLGWQVAAGAPLQPMDRLALLEAPGPTSRLELAARFVTSTTEVLEALLAGQPDDLGPD